MSRVGALVVPSLPAKAIRWLFALLVLALPVEVAVARAYSEPFPALFGPAFEGSQEADGAVDLQLSRVVLVGVDGAEHAVEPDVVLPPSESLGAALLQSGYRSEARANSPEARAWLAARVAEQLPGLEVASVVVEWRRATYDIATGTLSSGDVGRTVRVDLEPGS